MGNTIVLTNKRTTLLDLSGVTDVHGKHVLLAPAGKPGDQAECDAEMEKHANVQAMKNAKWLDVAASALKPTPDGRMKLPVASPDAQVGAAANSTASAAPGTPGVPATHHERAAKAVKDQRDLHQAAATAASERDPDLRTVKNRTIVTTDAAVSAAANSIQTEANPDGTPKEGLPGKNPDGTPKEATLELNPDGSPREVPLETNPDGSPKVWPSPETRDGMPIGSPPNIPSTDVRRGDNFDTPVPTGDAVTTADGVTVIPNVDDSTRLDAAKTDVNNDDPTHPEGSRRKKKNY